MIISINIASRQTRESILATESSIENWYAIPSAILYAIPSKQHIKSIPLLQWSTLLPGHQ